MWMNEVMWTSLVRRRGMCAARVRGLGAALVLVVAGALAAPPAAQADCLTPIGDINGSGSTDVVDVQCSILSSLWALSGSDPASVPACVAGDPTVVADANCDGSIDVVDVTLFINYALGQPLDPTIDGDQDGCPNTCDPCGDTVCDDLGGENCWTCPFDCGDCAGDCCAANGTQGCADPTCTDCVCGLDAFCCDSFWDDTCSAEAVQDCGAECGCPVPQQDCCTAGSFAGCADASCESCVCTLDDYCCTTQFDDVCAGEAAGVCNGDWYTGTFSLDGGQEVPPSSSTATGTATLTLIGTTLIYDITHDVANPVAAHIHVGAAGVSGPVLVTLATGGASSPISGQVDLPPADAAQLAADPAGFYVNIHSTDFPDGEIRGQVSLTVQTGCGCVAPGACCLPDGSCSETSDADCTAQGGAFTAGATCADANANGTADVCEPPADCCVDNPNGAPGCAGNTACETCVCGADSYCCDSVWDVLCADRANFQCFAECGCPAPGACCLPDGSCIETNDADCTAQGGTYNGSATCDDANLNGTADVCETPAQGDCCHATDAAGCTNAACESCVCGADSYCCDTAWDADCVDCANGGPGFGGACASVDCTADCGCTALGDCCAPQGGAGCVDAGCQDCVCANDPFCCNTQWDEQCVGTAVDVCGFFCNCPAPTACCDPSGTCTMEIPGVCTANGGVSVAGADCTDANGDNIADACFDKTAWACCMPDGSCAMQLPADCAAAGGIASPGADCTDADGNGAADVCEAGFGGCCDANGSPGCDDFTCTDCVCGLDPFCCDTEWDATCATEANQDCINECQCPGECCTANPTIGCRIQACQDCVCAADAFCCSTSWDANCVADAGTTCAADCGCPAPTACCMPDGTCDMLVPEVCTSLFGGVSMDGADCTDADQNGVADACDFAGDCCTNNGDPGCADPACTACVCSADSFCCTMSWDSDCADCAAGGGGYQDRCVGAACDQACGCTMACCMPDGSCTSDDKTTCNNNGGTWTAGGDCSDANGNGQADLCEPPTSACCMPDGSCAMLAQADCDASGGYWADGADCTDSDMNGVADACEFAGDCCTNNGDPGCADPSCTACVCGADPLCCTLTWDSDCADCAAGGGGFLDRCVGAACDQACGCTMACCMPDGSCTSDDKTTCNNNGGTWNAGADCSDANGNGQADICEPPMAACCMPDGSCAMQTEADCNTAGGTWNAGADCTDANGNGQADICEPPMAACCMPDGSCAMLAQADCDTAGGYWADGSDCTDADMNGVADACDFAGDCCTNNGDVGCADPACTACVCSADSYCCTLSWDSDCADCAAGGGGFLDRCLGAACDQACGCTMACCMPDGSCTGDDKTTCTDAGGTWKAGMDCTDANMDGIPDACFVPTGACCMGTIGGCQETTQADCDNANGYYNGDGTQCQDLDNNGLFDLCEFAWDCCTANGTTGCSDQACSDCVCTADPFCCNTSWDSNCAECASGIPGGLSCAPGVCDGVCQCP